MKKKKKQEKKKKKKKKKKRRRLKCQYWNEEKLAFALTMSRWGRWGGG
jgi:hypothetical protein